MPGLDRKAGRSRDQCDLLQVIAPVGDLRWDSVALTAVGKGAGVEGLEYDLNLLLEQLAVGVVVDDGASKVSTSRL